MALMDRRVRSGLDLITVINQGYFMTPAQELCGKFFDIVAAHLDSRRDQYVRDLRKLQGELIHMRLDSDCEKRNFDALEVAIQKQIENTESLISDGIYA